MYDVRFRKKVLEIREKEGLSIRAVADRFGISFRSIVSWLKNLEPKLKRKPYKTKIDYEALKEDIRLHKDSFYHERAHRLGASKSGVEYAMKRLGITYKKKPGASQGERRRTALLPKSG